MYWTRIDACSFSSCEDVPCVYRRRAVLRLVDNVSFEVKEVSNQRNKNIQFAKKAVDNIMDIGVKGTDEGEYRRGVRNGFR